MTAVLFYNHFAFFSAGYSHLSPWPPEGFLLFLEDLTQVSSLLWRLLSSLLYSPKNITGFLPHAPMANVPNSIPSFFVVVTCFMHMSPANLWPLLLWGLLGTGSGLEVVFNNYMIHDWLNTSCITTDLTLWGVCVNIWNWKYEKCHVFPKSKNYVARVNLVGSL